MSKITPAKSYEWKISLLFFSFLSQKRSLYRELLFLALVALRKNNINISKFRAWIF